MSIICLEPYSYATRLGEISRSVGTDDVSVACRATHVGWYGKALSMKPGIITSVFAGVIIRCDDAHFIKLNLNFLASWHSSSNIHLNARYCGVQRLVS